jgi:oligosaccharyltransferase complex subunit delta (ribophorin II)
MKTVIILALLVALASAAKSGFNPTISKVILKKQFDSVKPYSDLSSAFYSVKGLELVGEQLPQSSLNDICTFAKSKVDKLNLESIYYATSLANLVPNCQLTNAEFQATLNSAATSKNVAELYFYTLIAKNLKSQIDSKVIKQSLIDGLKTDSSIVNQAYSLHIATHLTPEHQKTFFDTIEDILDQADEVDKKFLQYEGGLATTSLVVEGIFTLAEIQKPAALPAKLDRVRLGKFVNYLTSKRYPTSVKSAYHLLKASLKLTSGLAVPLVLNRLSSVSVSVTNPNLLISITNIMGESIKQELQVIAESSKLLDAKTPFKPKSSDGTTFEISLLNAEAPKAAAFYDVTISASVKGNSNTFLVSQTVDVKIACQVDLSDVQVGLVDRDQSNPKLQKFDANLKLDGDQQSKFYLKFAIKEKSAKTVKLIEAHQTFVRFTHQTSQKEIVFLAQSKNSQYSAQVDFTTNSKNFRHQSGLYNVELIVSDPLIENPTLIKLAQVKLRFSDDQQQQQASEISLEKSKLYSKQPEIAHIFREAEQLPSSVVSSLFSILCLAPIGLLVILWLAIGFNFNKFQFTLASCVFHVTLLAIFGLLYCYWIKLNMFVTLKYLSVLAVVAYVSGNSLLRSLAAIKEKKN